MMYYDITKFYVSEELVLYFAQNRRQKTLGIRWIKEKNLNQEIGLL
jgi:hypothetical protein